MGAFILAGIVVVAGIVIWLFSMFAAGMSDSQSASADAASTANWILAFNLGLAALIVASHWLPHIGW